MIKADKETALRIAALQLGGLKLTNKEVWNDDLQKVYRIIKGQLLDCMTIQ